MTQEKVYKPLSGWPALLICVGLFVGSIYITVAFFASLPTTMPCSVMPAETFNSLSPRAGTPPAG